jgi:hypothetical protein
MTRRILGRSEGFVCPSSANFSLVCSKIVSCRTGPLRGGRPLRGGYTFCCRVDFFRSLRLVGDEDLVHRSAAGCAVTIFLGVVKVLVFAGFFEKYGWLAWCF